MYTDKISPEREIETGDANQGRPPRLQDVLKVVKLELVSLRVGGQERGRGFNPYDGQLGHANRDPWSRRRRT